jgi:shikimate dehydrogenase
MISGTTELIAHIGFPTHTFKSPAIYNPYFQQAGIDAVLVPMASEAADFPAFLRALFTVRNLRGAVITMPHKISTLGLLTHLSVGAQIAGACNAVRRNADGSLEGDMFDGIGFVRAVQRQGFKVDGARVLVVGAGGVGSAIAASLASGGAEAISLFDSSAESAQRLAERIEKYCPGVILKTGVNDASGYDLIVNATPMGMNLGDPMPLDVSRINAGAFVCDVVHSKEPTAFLQAAKARGARIQGGADMLYEQIPAYLEFFGLPTTTPGALRALVSGSKED